MNFDLTEEQRLLADSVRRFVAQEYGFEARRRIIASRDGYSPGVWKTFAEMGLLGLALPTEHGGFGGGAADLMNLMEAFGEALVVEPFLSTLVGARLVARSGNGECAAQILPAVAEGRAILAFAHAEEGARYDLGHVTTRARAEGGGYALDGRKRMVLHAPIASRLVVSAVLDGRIALFLVEPGSVAMEPCRTLDNFVAADIRLDELRVGPGCLVARDALPLIEEVVDWATALVCAEAVGAMRYANDATLEYLKTRRQFGVPIGSFQALQHRMVEMAITLEQARSMASLACSEVETARDARARKRSVSAAKIKISDACRHISQEAVQLHGGMGMTEELKVSHAFRRLTVIAQQFGDADHHLERFASTDKPA